MGAPADKGMPTALDWVERGILRVDPESGLAYRTFVGDLYTYERPVGVLTAAGYVRVHLGARLTVFTHRLMWTVLEGPIPPGMLINHINGVKRDNRRANLELVTARGNIQHAYDTGLMPSGKDHWKSALTDAQALAVIESVRQGRRRPEVAAEFRVSEATIDNVINRSGRYRRIETASTTGL